MAAICGVRMERRVFPAGAGPGGNRGRERMKTGSEGSHKNCCVVRQRHCCSRDRPALRRPAPALVRCRAAAPRPPVRSRGGSALSHTRRATGEGRRLAWPRSGGSSSRLRSESEACFLSCDAKSSKALRGLRSSPDFFRFPEGESIGDGLLPLAPAPEDEAGLGLAGLAAGRGEGGAAGTRTGAGAAAGFGGGAGAGAGACETAVARSM